MVPDSVTEEPNATVPDDNASDMEEVLRKYAVKLCAELIRTEENLAFSTSK